MANLIINKETGEIAKDVYMSSDGLFIEDDSEDTHYSVKSSYYFEDKEKQREYQSKYEVKRC